jgi:hypothetical protein
MESIPTSYYLLLLVALATTLAQVLRFSLWILEVVCKMFYHCPFLFRQLGDRR